MEAYRPIFLEKRTKNYSENTQSKIKMYLKGRAGMGWNNLAQNRIK